MFLQYKFSFSVLFWAPLRVIPSVTSHHCCMLVHVVQVAEGCRGLKLPQTALSTGLPTSPLEQTTFFPLLLQSQAWIQIHLVLQKHPMLAVVAAPAPVAPRPCGNTQHDMRLSLQLRALHRRDFLLHSSSASMSNPCDITSRV